MVSWILSSILLTAVAGQADCTMVYFGSAQCEPCQQMMPPLTRLQQEGWDIRAVNASERTDLVAQYKVENLPTVVIVSNTSRQEVDRIVGAVSYEKLLSRFSRAAARHQTSPGRASNAANSNAAVSSAAASNAANSNAASTPQTQASQPQPRSLQAEAIQSPLAQSPQPQSPLAQAQPSPRQAPQATSGPTVRGQSPNAGGFPMLAAGGVAPAVAAAVGAIAPRGVQPAVMAASSIRPAQAAQPQLSLEQAIARAAAATVRIKVEEANTTAYGTGTVIDVHGSEALVLTCGHLFRDMKPGSQLSVDLFAGTPREVNVLAQLIDFKAEEEDIGVVSFTLPVELEAVEILPRRETLRKGQAAFSFGCDHGNDPTRHDTTICSVNRYLGAANVEIVGAPAVGRSGGGLFDHQGRLIGVCNAACAQEDEGIYAAADVVYPQLERMGLSHLFDASQDDSAPGASPDAPSGEAVPVQPVVYGRPADTPAKPAASDQPTDSIDWPDQQFAGGAPATAGSQEIICIVRDATGKSRVMTIAGPSPELLSAIQEQSTAPAAAPLQPR